MKKLRFLGVLTTALLALSMIFASCASLDAWSRDNGGLNIEGVEDFEGYFISVKADTGDASYVGGTASKQGVQITGGKAALNVYKNGEEIPFDGDATVDFDVTITERADPTSRPVGIGNANAKLSGGIVFHVIPRITQNFLPPKPLEPVAPPAPVTPPTAAVPAGSPGLTLTGLSAWNGNYVIAAGKTGNTSFTAFSSSMEGARISGGTATLLVYGDGTRVYTGNAEVTFDVVINAAAPVRSDTVGMGSAIVKFTNGVGSGTVIGIVDLRRTTAATPAAPAAPAAPATASRLTITGLDAYNGKWIAAVSNIGITSGQQVNRLVGAGAAYSSINQVHGVRVANGRAVLRVTSNITGTTTNSAYTGNDTNSLAIFSRDADETFNFSVVASGRADQGTRIGYVNQVRFTNGSATAALSR
jgi:hypothetical protein